MTTRGRYLRDVNKVFGVITADLVESRARLDRESAQKRLARLVRVLNSDFEKAVRVPFMITLGDEIQGLIRHVPEIPRLIIAVHDIFPPREITVGVGVGRVTTGFSRRVTEMDGPVFVRARQAIEAAKKSSREVVVNSGSANHDGVINGIYSLIGGIKRGWTSEQWMRANLYRTLETVEKVAEHLGVAKQSVSKSLRNTLAKRVHEVEDYLPRLFSELPLTPEPSDGPGA